MGSRSTPSATHGAVTIEPGVMRRAPGSGKVGEGSLLVPVAADHRLARDPRPRSSRTGSTTCYPTTSSIRKRLCRRLPGPGTPRRSRCSRRSAATASARSSCYRRAWSRRAGTGSCASLRPTTRIRRSWAPYRRSGACMNGDDDDLPISLAGAQEKTALTKVGKAMVQAARLDADHAHLQAASRPHRRTRQLDMAHSLENEWLCAQLLRATAFRLRRARWASSGG